MASDDEYLSDLTDIESEEDEDPKNKKKSKKSSWRVRKALTPARATTYSAQALHGSPLYGLSRLTLISYYFRPNSYW